MTYSYEFDAQLGAFRVNWSQSITMAMVLEANRAMLETDHWGQPLRVLATITAGTDMSSLTVDQYVAQGIPHMEETASARGREAKSAWIPEDWRHAAILKAWDMLPQRSGLGKFRVCRTEAEAIEWLGCSELRTS